jgi:tetratricopeptide (TPR) repeat protein
MVSRFILVVLCLPVVALAVPPKGRPGAAKNNKMAFKSSSGRGLRGTHPAGLGRARLAVTSGQVARWLRKANLLVEKHGPFGDFFLAHSASTFVRRSPQIRRRNRMIKRTRDRIGRAKSVAELDRIAKQTRGQNLPALVRNELIKAYMDMASKKDPTPWARIADYWEAAARAYPDYKKEEIGREFYLVALNKQGLVDKSIAESERYIADLAGIDRKQLRGLNIRTVRNHRGRLNGEVLAALGKAYKLKGDLKESTRYYETGFAVDFEYYPGINAVYNNYSLGNIARAEALAPLVWTACEQAGGLESNDYWNLATQVELALIMGKFDALAKRLPKMLTQATQSWEISSTVSNMRDLSSQRKSRGEDTRALDFVVDKLGQRVKALDRYQDALKEASVEGNAAVEKVKATHQADSKTALALTVQTMGSAGIHASSVVETRETRWRRRATDRLLKNSGDFRTATMSHAVGGNVAYGGQIPDAVITRQTVRNARQVLKSWGLTKVEDFEAFKRVVDAKIGDLFDLVGPDGAMPLEDLHGPAHVVLDNFAKNRFKIALSKELGDSRTDLLVTLLLGIGDCRPTNHIPQLLFDVWQRDNVNRHLEGAMDAGIRGDSATQGKGLARARYLQRTRLLTVSGMIKAPIQMAKLYSPIVDPKTGRLVRSQGKRYHDVENHTFNIVAKFDDNGLLERDGVRFADAFYRKRYPLAEGLIQLSELQKDRGFYSGVMGISAADGKRIPFRIQFSPYSGTLLKKFSVGSTEALFAGQVVGPLPLNKLGLPNSTLKRLARQIADVKVEE